MADKRVNQLRKEAERQGWIVIPIKAGWLLRSPDGVTQVTLHGTPSDHHWFDNTVARMRKGGFVWPPPKGR